MSEDLREINRLLQQIKDQGKQSVRLMTIEEAVKNGIRRLRLPSWNPRAYIVIHLMDNGLRGPWLALFDRYGQEAIGEPTPQVILACHLTDREYVAYKGEIDVNDSAPQEG